MLNLKKLNSIESLYSTRLSAYTTKSTLNYFQMSVEHFSNWEKALHSFEDFQPDIIFIDITLKDKITGFDFVEIIRKK